MPGKRTWKSVYEALGVSKNTFDEWRLREDAPRSPDVALWSDYARKSGLLTDDQLVSTSDLPGECSYDVLVQDGKVTYAEAKLREDVINRQLKNRNEDIIFENEMAKQKELEGRLVDKSVVREAIARTRDNIQHELQGLARVVIPQVDGLTPKQTQQLQKAIDKSTELLLIQAVENAKQHRP